MVEQPRDPHRTRFASRDKDVIHVSLSLDNEIPAHLRPVLHELVLGEVDATACRRLNVSPRTFSRRVAELLEHLGVESRFQAGMQVVLWELQHPAHRAVDAGSQPGPVAG